MNQLLQLDSTDLWHLGGWTMVHFLWLGTLAGVVAAALRTLLWRAGPNIRYAAALVSFLLLAALPLGIAAWLVQSSPIGARGQIGVAQFSFESLELNARMLHSEVASQLPVDALSRSYVPVGHSSIGAEADAQTVEVDRQSRGLSGESDLSPYFAIVAWLALSVPFLPWLWLVGTPITLALLTTGIVGSERLRRAGRPIVDGLIAERAAQLAKSLGIGGRVLIAVCERVTAPVLVGILRPMILLPPSALTGWSPDEIEMVLLHELAHVRRRDNLVNLVQRLIESLLFFHPAVWLVSRWARSEREACCDAFVIRRTSRPHAYAELLVALAAQMPRSVLFQPAASSALTARPLRTRIRRILQLEDDPMLISGKTFTLMLATFLTAVTLVVFYLPSRGQAEGSITDPATKEGNSAGESADAIAEPGEPVVPSNVPAEQADAITSGSVPSEDASETQPNAGDGSDDKSNERIFVAYNIEPELLRGVEQWAELMKVRSRFRGDGGFILQAPPVVHDQLQTLLEATPKWSDPNQAAMRAENPVVASAEEGKSRVEWRTMGMTLGEPRQVKRSQFAPREVVGLEVLAVEPGSPAAWLTIKPDDTLVKISNFDTANLAELASMIRTLLDGSARTRHTITVVRSNGEQIHTYLPQVRTDITQRAWPTQASSKSEAQAVKSAKFPTLDEQKLADLAYQRLELELEPVTEEEMQRVKALGYDGGVRVAQVAGRAEGRFQSGDILVGLHVWPTTSMKAVAEILNRDDLAELNPLKFYAVRKDTPFDSQSANDFVQSGRVMVNLPNSAGSYATYPSSLEPEVTANKAVTTAATSVQSTAAPQAPEVPRFVVPSAAEEADQPKASDVQDKAPDRHSYFRAQQNKPDDADVVLRGSQEALENFMKLASARQANESIGVLKKSVEREQRKYQHMEELVAKGVISTGELDTQKADYQISIERLKQAERALEYYKLLVDYAAAEYQAAVDANKSLNGAVSEHELRRLKLKVELAEAQLKALSE